MPEEKVMTLEEFLEMKRQEARQIALANSYNATEPRLAKRWYSQQDYNYLNNLIDNEEEWLKGLEDRNKRLENRMYNPILLSQGVAVPSNELKHHLKYNNSILLNDADDILNKIHDSKNLISEYKDRLVFAKENGYDWTGSNCITNATGWYGDNYVCANNDQFKDNPSKYGFVKINVEDALPGDILQIEEEGDPYHAIMLSKKGDDGKYYSNYSSGGTESSSLKKDSDWWGRGDNAFRFVGLPEDIEAWTQEYNDTYKKLGGMKKVRKKKMLGAAIIGAATSLIGTGLNLDQQKNLHDEQMAQQKEHITIANANARIANLNQLANNDMSWAYNKFNNFRCGGKKRMKANLGKFKPRFEK